MPDDPDDRAAPPPPAVPEDVPSAPVHGAQRRELDRLTLRFTDPELERAFRTHHFRQSVTTVRTAHLLGVGLWVVWGLLVGRYLGEDRTIDLQVRYGVFIPLLLAGLAFSFTRLYARWWEIATVAVLILTVVGWITYVAGIESMPVDYGYVGVILIMIFSFTLTRLRFLHATITSVVMIVFYLAVAPSVDELTGLRLLLASFYLVSFWVLGIITSYTLERNTRLLFLRQRELDRERRRSDALLLNILPRAIIDRLKSQQERTGRGRLAEALDEVTVLFADAVGFTEQAGKTSPDRLVDALDRFFTRCDAIADRHGLEKIKTAGDAYMAVAGAPDPRPDHAEAAAEMALAILEEVDGARWPSGDPIRVRIGIASGPAVAGVIGQRKFAYDLWGDTVNLASRLESQGEPGRILVSEAVAERLRDRFRFGPPLVVDLKGKGPTPARFLVGRDGSGNERRDAGELPGDGGDPRRSM